MKKILSIFPAVIFCFLLNNVHAQTNVQDSLALVDLYNSTNGASWTSSTNWLAGPVSTWQGITVSAGRVKEINLTANNLTGTLPVSIGNLSELDSLTLVGNFISGSVPSSLGNLSKLVWLDLTYNQFTGSIPSSLSTLANLDLLSLSSNNLSGSIPTEFGNFKKITELDLSFNSLTGSIPSSLGNVTTLNVLNLEFNLLSGSIPAQISQLSSLKKLLLDNNNLTGSLPAKMNNLSRLSSLNLSSNQLSGSIPEDVTNKVNINYFNLGNNNFTGSIPVSFGNCTNLVFLWLNNNSLSGSVPAELLNITTLQSLWLYSNKLNFNGMEGIAQTFSFAQYTPQASIKLNYNDNKLSVTAGGTLANNTYHWYKGSSLIAENTGDSTLPVFDNGKYSVAVTNNIATQLTLYSDTVNLTTLPVHFISFTAALVNSNAQLNWKTSSEQNVSGYHIQRSADGIHFTTIADVKAGSNNYSYNDIAVVNLGMQKIYYRIEEYDTDGKIQLSDIRQIDIKNAISKLFVYPNPAKDFINVRIPQDISATAKIVIYNISGSVISQQAVSPLQYAKIDVSSLANGMYSVAILDNGHATYSQVFQVQH